MSTYTTYHCPQCGKQYFGEGRLGGTYQCTCGCRIAASSADNYRRDLVYIWAFSLGYIPIATAVGLLLFIKATIGPSVIYRFLAIPMVLALAALLIWRLMLPVTREFSRNYGRWYSRFQNDDHVLFWVSLFGYIATFFGGVGAIMYFLVEMIGEL